MNQAYGQWVVADLIGAAAVRDRAADFARPLRQEGGFLVASGVTQPDLRSTMMGRRILGELPGTSIDWARGFSGDGGIWMLVPGSDGGNVMNFETVYLGLTLAGLTSDDRGVF